MAFIRISCGCGRSMKVDTVHAGKKVKCPDCGALSVIPGEGRETTSGPVVPPGEPPPAAADTPAAAPDSPAAQAAPESPPSGKMPTASGKSAVAGSGKSATGTPSGKSSTVAPHKPTSEPVKPGAEPAPARKVGSGYDLLGAVLGAALVGLAFVPWIELRDRRDQNMYRATGFQLMTGDDSERKLAFLQGLEQPDVLARLRVDKAVVRQALTDRYLEAAWVPMIAMTYVGLAGLTFLLALLNWLTGAVGAKFVGGLMTLTGIVCMGVLAVILFVANKPPEELGSVFADSFKYKGIIPSFAVMGLAFVLFGFGVIYFLTGGAPVKSRPAPRRAMIGGGPPPTSFEMPE